MSYQNFDKEIAHLERVFGLISIYDRIPLSYWRNRLSVLSRSRLMPTQQARIARLEATLRSLEQAEEIAAAPPMRSNGTRR
ncbi:hypothetical protein [Paraburkholderia fungorum]|jgi:hypothetical protein|uniref:hypothetical protein n=1 Tax=Paraburkholderia fungorum TaxID=134537 RepID=UPI0038BBEB40